MLEKQRYRAHYLSADIAQCRIALLVLIAPLAPFLYVDYTEFGWSAPFLELAAVRLGFAVATFAIWLRLPAMTEAQQLDRYIVSWSLAGVAMVIYSEVVKPTDLMGHFAVDVWIVVTFFAALPLPTRTKMLPGTVFVAAELAQLLLHKQPHSSKEIVYPLLALLLSIASGAVIAMRLDRYRRDALTARLEAEHQANTDSLTGLANRRAFMQAAAKECDRHQRSAEPLGLILMDLDEFKHVNDTHGHEAGDAVLIECAQRLPKVLRRYDMCARIGGEEFCVLMPGADLQTAVATAERMSQTLRLAPIHYGEESIPIRASFGVAQWLPGDAGIERALTRADAALYQAKRGGRDRVVANDARPSNGVRRKRA